MEGDKQSLDTFSRSIAKSGLSPAGYLANESSNEEIIEGISILTGPDAQETLWSRINSAFFSEPISILRLGRLENSLKKGGLVKVGQLVKWAEADFQPPVRYVRGPRLAAVQCALEDLCEHTQGPLWSRINSAFFSEPISILRLGRLENSLKKGGLVKVGQLVKWAEADFQPPVRYVGELKIAAIKCALEDLCEHTQGSLWSRINSAFFSEPISILRLGRLENSLKKGGLVKVGQLVKWAEADFQPPVRYVGELKIAAIKCALEDLCERSTVVNLSFFDILEKFGKIDPTIVNIPVTGFHLGPRASSLHAQGYDTVGSLFSWYKGGAPVLKNFGKKSVVHAKKIIEALPPAIDEQMGFDWDIFCARADITLLPKAKNIPVGPEFLKSIPRIIEGIVSVAADSIEADIVSDRLTKFTAEQHTLEELGLKHGVTRERIRQKQKKLLLGISEGLLDGHYETAQYRFRPEYAALWQEAEEAFKGQEELNANSFFEALTATWKVTRNDLIEHLPFIFAVLTKSGRIPGSFKIYVRFPLLLKMELPDLIALKPLQELRLGRYADLLEIAEIKTVGDLLRELVADEKKTPNAAAQTVLAALDRIESFIEQIDCIHDFSWEGYYEFHGRTILPDGDTQSPTSFLESLKPVILRAVEEGEFYQYSREILIYRSFPPKNERITAQEIANMVGTHGPTISKNELVMNTRLKAQLVARDFSRSSIIFRDSFLAYWKELSEAHERCSSVSEFKFKMTNQWNLVPGVLDDTINLIWSILSFHPPGKNSRWYEGKKKAREQKDVNDFSVSGPPVIILRKKRSIH